MWLLVHVTSVWGCLRFDGGSAQESVDATSNIHPPSIVLPCSNYQSLCALSIAVSFLFFFLFLKLLRAMASSSSSSSPEFSAAPTATTSQCASAQYAHLTREEVLEELSRYLTYHIRTMLWLLTFIKVALFSIFQKKN